MVVVLKFGGSSVATAEKIYNAAAIVADFIKDGYKVVMVVSAKGDTTDDLLKQASEINDKPLPRELDALISVGEQMSVALMAMCLSRIGIPSISLCGWQAGVFTDSNHGDARIIGIYTDRVEAELEKGNVVIVAGFQGIDKYGDITTIGRGGSDTSAVALAAALKAEKCYIYTDVDGVYSTDPRKVSQAFKHDVIYYDEMLEMASLGAGVLHNRSVELAKNTDVVIKVLNSKNSEGGTEVNKIAMEGRKVSGVTCDMNTVLVELKGADIESLPSVLNMFAEYGITSDMMTSIEGRLGITIPKSKAEQAVKALCEYGFDEENVVVDYNVAKISVVGCGLGGDPSVAAKMLNTVKNAGVYVKSMVAGEIKISILIPEMYADTVVREVHKAFFEK